MAYSEDDLLPLSGLQHFVFCQRQAALIHVEGTWKDNALTVYGQYVHKTVHSAAPRRERRGDLVILRGVALRSLHLGLAGYADVVEFRRSKDRAGVRVQGESGLWMPFAVEYKSGLPKDHAADDVQLCAQAMCLEEMLGVVVEEGAIFYGRMKRRKTVILDHAVREMTREAAQGFRSLVEGGVVPPARNDMRCKTCSLLDVCLPQLTSNDRSARKYLGMAVRRAMYQEHER